MEEKENKVEELLRRVKMTTSSRYAASERLKFHDKATQWTIAFISVVLIFIPMAITWGLKLGVSNEELNFYQSVLAIMVLVYSLLLGQERFALRADSMHRNGVELGRFARKLRVYIDVHSDYKYNELIEEYYAILDKYENHSLVDYYKTSLYNKPKKFSEYPAYIILYFKERFWSGREGLLYIPAWTFIIYVTYTVFQR